MKNRPCQIIYWEEQLTFAAYEYQLSQGSQETGSIIKNGQSDESLSELDQWQTEANEQDQTRIGLARVLPESLFQLIVFLKKKQDEFHEKD